MLVKTTHTKNAFIEHQLGLAATALKAKSKSVALSHYQSAYEEALWLCEHSINHPEESDTISAKTAYDSLSHVSELFLKHIDSSERAEEIKGRLLGISMRISSEFDMEIRPDVLSDAALSTASTMSFKLKFFKSVFA